jgi:ribosome-binding protein aMBF1 (putative translation factor)
VTPLTILTAVRMGQSALSDRHAALAALWRHFGASVRRARKERGISTKAFAKRLRRTPAMLQMMETGKRSWPMPMAEKAARMLTRPVQWPDAGRDKL